MDYTTDDRYPTAEDAATVISLPNSWGEYDPLLYLPRQAGDPWDNLKISIDKYDTELCDGWNDDISTLLTFIGLFSAIVTAFIIESYTWLEEDPRAQSNRVLAQILDHLMNSSVVSEDIDSIGGEFAPDRMAVRVNVLWFLSLTISLSAALVGILCKQWLREYQRDVSVSSKAAIMLRQMRFNGLVAWHFPAIISSLPILVQISVFLFFAGMLELLWSRNTTVAACASAIVGSIGTFAALTTIVPSLDVSLSIGGWLGTAPMPCPYKSPQAWLLCRFIAPALGTIFNLENAQRFRKARRPFMRRFYIMRHRWIYSPRTRPFHTVLTRFLRCTRDFFRDPNSPSPDNQHHQWFKTEYPLLQRWEPEYTRQSMLWIRDNLGPTYNTSIRVDIVRCFTSFEAPWDALRILSETPDPPPITYFYYELLKDHTDQQLALELLIRTTNSVLAKKPLPGCDWLAPGAEKLTIMGYALRQLRLLLPRFKEREDILLQVVLALENVDILRMMLKPDVLPEFISFMVYLTKSEITQVYRATIFLIHRRVLSRFSDEHTSDNDRFRIAYYYSLVLVKYGVSYKTTLPTLRHLFIQLDAFLTSREGAGRCHTLRGYIDNIEHEVQWGAIRKSLPGSSVLKDVERTHRRVSGEGLVVVEV